MNNFRRIGVKSFQYDAEENTQRLLWLQAKTRDWLEYHKKRKMVNVISIGSANEAKHKKPPKVITVPPFRWDFGQLIQYTEYSLRRWKVLMLSWDRLRDPLNHKPGYVDQLDTDRQTDGAIQATGSHPSCSLLSPVKDDGG